MINFNGDPIEIMELSNRFNVPWSTINNRYKRGVRGDDLIANKPLSHIKFKDEKVGWTELEKRHGIPKSTLISRYKNGLRNEALVAQEHKGKFSKNAAVKLTESDVIEIKKLIISSTLRQWEIAKKYGVDQSHISDIKRGKRWPEIKVDIVEALSKN